VWGPAAVGDALSLPPASARADGAAGGEWRHGRPRRVACQTLPPVARRWSGGPWHGVLPPPPPPLPPCLRAARGGFAAAANAGHGAPPVPCAGTPQTPLGGGPLLGAHRPPPALGDGVPARIVKGGWSCAGRTLRLYAFSALRLVPPLWAGRRGGMAGGSAPCQEFWCPRPFLGAHWSGLVANEDEGATYAGRCCRSLPRQHGDWAGAHGIACGAVQAALGSLCEAGVSRVVVEGCRRSVSTVPRPVAAREWRQPRASID